MFLKTNAFFLLFFVGVFSIQGVAQIDYNLKDFKTPDIHYRRLDANTFFSGSQNNFESSTATNGSGALSFDFYGYNNTDISMWVSSL